MKKIALISVSTFAIMMAVLLLGSYSYGKKLDSETRAFSAEVLLALSSELTRPQLTSAYLKEITTNQNSLEKIEQTLKGMRMVNPGDFKKLQRLSGESYVSLALTQLSLTRNAIYSGDLYFERQKVRVRIHIVLVDGEYKLDALTVLLEA